MQPEEVKDTYLGAQRAAVVVAHSIPESIYFILRDGADYQEMRPTFDGKHGAYALKPQQFYLRG